jgi:hypothetical protein
MEKIDHRSGDRQTAEPTKGRSCIAYQQLTDRPNFGSELLSKVAWFDDSCFSNSIICLILNVIEIHIMSSYSERIVMLREKENLSKTRPSFSFRSFFYGFLLASFISYFVVCQFIIKSGES